MLKSERKTITAVQFAGVIGLLLGLTIRGSAALVEMMANGICNLYVPFIMRRKTADNE